MHPPPGQTGCPELGPGKKGSKQTQSCNSLHTSCAFVKSLETHCSFAPLYLQLAAVQAGHWNLLHFHLPALPDEQSLLWSCCRAGGIGQNRAAAEGGGIQSTTLASHTLQNQAEEISCETLDALNDAATHSYTLNAAGETLPTFTTCGTAENRKLIVWDGTWRSSTFLITTLQVWTLLLKSSLAKTMLKKTKSAAVNRLEGHNMPKCWEGRETPNSQVKGGSN